MLKQVSRSLLLSQKEKAWLAPAQPSSFGMTLTIKHFLLCVSYQMKTWLGRCHSKAVGIGSPGKTPVFEGGRQFTTHTKQGKGNIKE